jgi:hypothetical protein
MTEPQQSSNSLTHSLTNQPTKSTPLTDWTDSLMSCLYIRTEHTENTVPLLLFWGPLPSNGRCQVVFSLSLSSNGSTCHNSYMTAWIHISMNSSRQRLIEYTLYRCVISPREYTLPGNTHGCIRYDCKLLWEIYLRRRPIQNEVSMHSVSFQTETNFPTVDISIYRS